MEVFYTDIAQNDIIDSCLISILQLHLTLPFNNVSDILVFLPGEEEIENLNLLLKDRLTKLPAEVLRFSVLPIYSALPSTQQMLVFEPAPENTRKIILATNIAETSITINGVGIVLDAGLVRARIFMPKTGMEYLTTQETSKAEAKQRAGRAGREAKGSCYRLYTEDSFNKMKDDIIPDIQRSNLSAIVLSLKALKVKDVINFDFMDPPPKRSLSHALHTLLLLGCLDNEGELSKLGQRMLKYPLDPTLCRVLLAAYDMDAAENMDTNKTCLENVLSVISMLSVQGVFYIPRQSQKQADAMQAKLKFIAKEGDHITLLNVYNGFCTAGAAADTGKIINFDESNINANKNESKHGKRIRQAQNKWCEENYINSRSLNQCVKIRSQLSDLCSSLTKNKNSESKASKFIDTEKIRKAFLHGFFMKTAKREPDGMYRTLSDHTVVHIHPASALYNCKPAPDAIFYNELVVTKKHYLREVTAFEFSWLTEIAPKSFKPATSSTLSN